MVTGAAGAVGSAVGQIAKLRGCRVVGEYYVLAETVFIRGVCCSCVKLSMNISSCPQVL